MLTSTLREGQPGRQLVDEEELAVLPPVVRLSHASTSSCRLEKAARVRDHSDALCQLEPSDAHASMVTSSFHLDPRHFASVWDGRPPGGLYVV